MRCLVQNALCFVFSIVLINSSLAQDDLVGLYFDVDGLVTCTSTQMVPMDVYILLKNASYPDDVAGWEMGVHSDSQILLGSIEIYGESINVDSFPQLKVGLSEPLIPSGGNLLLAKISVFPMGEGEMWLAANETPSIQGSRYPVYSRYSSGELIEMAVGLEGEYESRVSFSSSCEQPLAQTTGLLDEYEIEGATPAGVEAVDYFYDLNLPPDVASPDRAELAIYFSEIAFIGEVEEVQYKCLNLPDVGVTSLALIQFKVEENICGVRGNRIVVETIVNRPGECVRYLGDHFSEFNVGEKFLVGAYREKGRRVTVPVGSMWRYAGGVLASSLGEKSSGDSGDWIGRVRESRNIVEQAENADFVGTVRVEGVWKEGGIRYAGVSVLRSIVGGQGEASLIIKQSRDSGRVVIDKSLKSGESYLVFLKEGFSDFEPLYGRLSFFLLRDGRLYEHRGREWGLIETAIDMVEGVR